jgi:hypothetical protein
VDHNNKSNIHRIITDGHNKALELEKMRPGVDAMNAIFDEFHF